jgi:hypothetical protein
MGIFDRLVSGFFKSANKDFYNKGSILGFIQMCVEERIFERSKKCLKKKSLK